MPELQLTTCPLKGRHLIEASAGTGKTYTLVHLYLRLLFERQLLPSQILVVTFTDAATQELTQRLRHKLREFRAWLMGVMPEDAFTVERFETIQAKVTQTYGPQALSQHSLRVEQNFDDAPISTIHSFCQRSLQRYALHSRQAFHYRLDNNTEDQRLQCIADAWRQQFYPDAAEDAEAKTLLHLLLEQKITPESLNKTLKLALENPDLRCVPDPEAPDLSVLSASLHEAVSRLCHTWQHSAEAVYQCLHTAIEKGHLKATSYKLDTLARGFETLNPLLQPATDGAATDAVAISEQLIALPTSPKTFELFTQVYLHKSKKAKQPDISEDQDFFVQAQAVLELIETTKASRKQAVAVFYQQILRTARQHFKATKAQSQLLDFQDLLTHLADALAPGPTGDTLAELLHQDLPVALIDEFQDTDRWQYTIFDRIYAQGDIFFIGDPKQSIYRFRGADLQVYLKAKDSVPEAHRWTLNTNYRSEANYIAAMNAFFTHAHLPAQGAFAMNEIQYQQVQASPAKQATVAKPSLLIWYAHREDDKKYKQYDFERQLIAGVVESIVQELVQGTSASEMAILVSRHRQSERLAHALHKRGIPCLVHGQRNIFKSKEAQDMVLFLEAVLSPREALSPVFSAYALGYTAEDIHTFQSDEKTWVIHLEKCQGLRQQWQSYGFFTMWSAFVHYFKIYTRSLAFAHGERAVTNFRHLAQLLQHQAQAQALSPEHTLLWLQRQIQSPPSGSAQEEHLLHLESEREAVQILTMHQSKGLEYPVVFCPYLWMDGSSRMTPPYTVVLPHGETVLDLGSEDNDEYKALAKIQILEDQLRLSYVAMTRAAKRCHVFWGFVSGHGQSPLQYYFQAKDKNKDATLDLLQELARSAHIQAMPFLSTEALPKIAQPIITPSKTDAEKPDATSKAWAPAKNKRIPASFQITSFTRLSAQADENTEEKHVLPEAAESASEASRQADLQKQPLLGFPRGAESGIFLHSVLESLRFEEPLAKQEALIQQQLAAHGFDSHWEAPLQSALAAILQAPFDSQQLCLAKLDPQHCLKEWDFDLYLPSFDTHKIQAIYAAHHSSYGGSQKPKPSPQAQTYLTGSIDLVFCHGGRYFIADYKSNDLGIELGHYGPSDLEAAMVHHQYFLQLTLYTLALHIYLTQTLPEYSYAEHMGGGYYFFLRGMHPELAGNGVYTHRPDQELIEDLAQHWSHL